MDGQEHFITGNGCVIPVIARPVGWEDTELRGLRPLPATGEIGAADNESALAEVARGLAGVT